MGAMSAGKVSPTSSTLDIPMEYNPDGRLIAPESSPGTMTTTTNMMMDKWKENLKFESTEDKNLAILKYLFPFYDINILKVEDGCFLNCFLYFLLLPGY